MTAIQANRFNTVVVQARKDAAAGRPTATASAGGVKDAPAMLDETRKPSSAERQARPSKLPALLIVVGLASISRRRVAIVKKVDGCRVRASQITSDVYRRCYLSLVFLLKDSNHVWKNSK
jgi:hypothetical protein